MFKQTESNFYRTSDNEQIFFSRNFTTVDPSRPVLIFNYGLVCSNHHWKYQLGHFDEMGHQILTHDYRGHFQSSGGHELEKLTFPQMSADINGICEFLGIKRAVVLGHSMGVNVCLQLAKDHPHLVEGMVLISGTFMPVKDVMFDSNIMDMVSPMLQAGHEKYPTFFKKLFATSGLNPLVKPFIHATGFNRRKVSREFIEIYLNRCGQLGVEVFFQLFNEMTRQNITSNLERMKIPALIIGGMKDNVIPNHLQRTLASLLPNSETYFLKEGSHVPQADFPEMINERIDIFLHQHSR